MKAEALKKGTIYTNTLDKAIPLYFTGKTTTRTQYGHDTTIAYFTPVKTEANKNWYDDIKTITKAFDDDNGNDYIQPSA